MKGARWAVAAAIIFAACTTLSATVQAATRSDAWVGSWASAQMSADPAAGVGEESWPNTTLRQTVRLTLSGDRLRLRLSNAFGAAPLHIAAVHVAHARASGVAAIDPASDRAVTFNGKADVTIPAGADYLSDPVDLPVTAQSDLAISLYYANAPVGVTGHPGSRTTSFLVTGNHTADADLNAPKKTDHWFQIAAVDVVAPKASAVVTFGDSITDGYASTTNANNRWPDTLAARLKNTGVLNLGIGGNRLLYDHTGPNALARFDRDVLAMSGVHAVILLEGINDLGMRHIDTATSEEDHSAKVAEIVGAYRQFIDRAHAAGLKVIGATITPFIGSDYYHPGAASEADRQQINGWIRTPGHFDAVVDFDAVVRDPAHPDRLIPAFDSGDHLHPSPAGYRAMGEAVPVTLLTGKK
ncbi:MAG: SGNH/GDSL hydrolase family protein [Rhizomicrobium sp.]